MLDSFIYELISSEFSLINAAKESDITSIERAITRIYFRLHVYKQTLLDAISNI